MYIQTTPKNHHVSSPDLRAYIIELEALRRMYKQRSELTRIAPGPPSSFSTPLLGNVRGLDGLSG